MSSNTNEIRCAIVVTAAACMPGNCWGRYLRVGAVVVDAAKLVELRQSTPKMLSTRARGVIEILETWERQHSGGPKSAAQLAIKAAEDLCDEWNAELGEEAWQGCQMLDEFTEKWCMPWKAPAVFTADNTEGYTEQDLQEMNYQVERDRRRAYLDYDDPDFEDRFKGMQERVVKDQDSRIEWRNKRR